jgi:hypothetical protein
MTDLTSVQAGYEFPSQEIQLDRPTVSAYVAAVEDPFPSYHDPSGLVPPLAALALAMRGLADLLARYPGVLHATQELTSLRPIQVGSVLRSTLVVRTRAERRGYAWLTVDTRIAADGVPALQGSMLLMVPLAAGGAVNG